MSKGIKAAIVAVTMATALGSTLSAASAHGTRYPLTQCGPDRAYLCPIRGYFNMTPFTYSLAIHPRCLRNEIVETAEGPRRRLVLVCG